MYPNRYIPLYARYGRFIPMSVVSRFILGAFLATATWKTKCCRGRKEKLGTVFKVPHTVRAGRKTITFTTNSALAIRDHSFWALVARLSRHQYNRHFNLHLGWEISLFFSMLFWPPQVQGRIL